jgi:hypothetical protein
MHACAGGAYRDLLDGRRMQFVAGALVITVTECDMNEAAKQHQLTTPA